METVGNRSDSIYLAIENSSLSSIKNSLFSRISAISKPSSIEKERCILAFDYTEEDFYGKVKDRWIHGWTGEKGVTGKYSYLTSSIVNRDVRLPIMSIPSLAMTVMSSEVLFLLGTVMKVFPNIDLILFDRGFYSKELIMKLNNLSVPYIIFVPKRKMEKKELESMSIGEKRVIVHQFSIYSDHKKINGDTKLAFLRRILDRKRSEYYDWVFATNMEEVNLDAIIPEYKMRWRIETMFRVQDECKIKTK